MAWSYRVAGTGGEGVLLLPGAVGSGEVYFPLLDDLAGELQLVAIEAGHGLLLERPEEWKAVVGGFLRNRPPI